MVLKAGMARGRVVLYLGKQAVEQNNIRVLSAQGGPDQPHPALTAVPQDKEAGTEGDYNTSQANASPTEHSLTPTREKQAEQRQQQVQQSSDHQANTR